MKNLSYQFFFSLVVSDIPVPAWILNFLGGLWLSKWNWNGWLLLSYFAPVRDYWLLNCSRGNTGGLDVSLILVSLQWLMTLTRTRLIWWRQENPHILERLMAFACEELVSHILMRVRLYTDTDTKTMDQKQDAICRKIIWNAREHLGISLPSGDLTVGHSWQRFR